MLGRACPYEAPCGLFIDCEIGPLAHQVEHHTFNVVVAGSSPARLTTFFTKNQIGR